MFKIRLFFLCWVFMNGSFIGGAVAAGNAGDAEFALGQSSAEPVKSSVISEKSVVNSPALGAVFEKSRDGMARVLKQSRFGVGLAGLSFPHYPGSKHSSNRVIPIPYLEYYGDALSVDDKGLKAKIFVGENWQLGVSVNGALPVDSQDDEKRAGMVDLYTMGEIGPELRYILRDAGGVMISLDFPLRVNLLLENDFLREQGASFEPRLHIEKNTQNWSGEIDIGPLYANERYMDVFYEVPQAYTSPTRNRYDADLGLLSLRLSATLKYRFGDYIGIIYGRAMSLSEATNRDSPLVATDHYFAGGIAIIRTFTW